MNAGIKLPRVLLIEDDARFAAAVDRWLAELGYRAEHVASSAEGLARLGEERYDALLLDLGLPDLHGHAVIRQLNNLGVSVPTIVVSGTTDMDDVIRAMRERASDFLRKPFSIDDLSSALDRAIRGAKVETRRAEVARPEPTPARDTARWGVTSRRSSAGIAGTLGLPAPGARTPSAPPRAPTGSGPVKDTKKIGAPEVRSWSALTASAVALDASAPRTGERVASAPRSGGRGS